jgi:hypothetical protein
MRFPVLPSSTGNPGVWGTQHLLPVWQKLWWGLLIKFPYTHKIHFSGVSIGFPKIFLERWCGTGRHYMPE